MIEFFNIHNIYITILLPILILLFWWSRKTYTSNLRKFGGAKVLEHLMPDSSKYVPTIKFSILLIALSLVIIILCRPCVSHKKETTTGSGNEVFIVLDVSNSMLASSSDDQNGTPRLLKSKMLLEKLINTFKDEQFKQQFENMLKEIVFTNEEKKEVIRHFNDSPRVSCRSCVSFLETTVRYEAAEQVDDGR